MSESVWWSTTQADDKLPTCKPDIKRSSMYSAFIWRCVILVEFCFFAEESSAFSLFLTRTFSHFLSLRIQTFGWFRYKINKGINPLMKSLKGLKILIKNLVTLKKEIWGEANAASNFIY